MEKITIKRLTGESGETESVLVSMGGDVTRTAAVSADGSILASAYGSDGRLIGQERLVPACWAVKGEAAGKPAKRFIRPTIEEVRAYCAERGSRIDPAAFVSYYESNGWKVGKNPMKDWRAAVRTWEQRDGGASKPQGSLDVSALETAAKAGYRKMR